MRLRGEGQAPVPVPAMEAELFVRAAGARTGHLFEPQRTDPFPIACLAAATDDDRIGPCGDDLQVMLGIGRAVIIAPVAAIGAQRPRPARPRGDTPPRGLATESVYPRSGQTGG